MTTTSATYIKNLQVLHKALMVGVILFCSITVYIINQVNNAPKLDEQLHRFTIYIAPIIALLGILLSTILYKKSIDNILVKSNLTLGQKLEQYRKACIVRWAFIEGAMLFCTVLLFITGKYYYLIFLFILLVFFIMYAPSKELSCPEIG
jgi:fructose-specific phosphotransferase system IIC component